MRISDWSSDVCSTDLPVLTDARRFSCSGGETEREHTRRLLQPFVAAGAPLSGRPRPESQPDLCGGRGRARYLCSSRFDELDICIAIEERCVFESESYVNPSVDGVSHKLRHIAVQSGDNARRARHPRLQERTQ